MSVIADPGLYAYQPLPPESDFVALLRASINGDVAELSGGSIVMPYSGQVGSGLFSSLGRHAAKIGSMAARHGKDAFAKLAAAAAPRAQELAMDLTRQGAEKLADRLGGKAGNIVRQHADMAAEQAGNQIGRLATRIARPF